MAISLFTAMLSLLIAVIILAGETRLISGEELETGADHQPHPDPFAAEVRKPSEVRTEPKEWERWDDEPEHLVEWPNIPSTTTTELPLDPEHRGLLKDIGSIGVGFNVGVVVPGNDPVSVRSNVNIGLGQSGLAGTLPVGQNIFPRQGEYQSLNDYDGDKLLIVPDKAAKFIRAMQLGLIRPPKYQPVKNLVGVNGGVGVG